MTKPLALLLHERLLPGSKLAGRFDELLYRVRTLADPARLVAEAQAGLPMVIVADLAQRRPEVLAAVTELHARPETAHIPIIGYLARDDAAARREAAAAGIKVVATDTTVVAHLPQFLELALHVE
ncbi:MAG TPA: hypothetical protein PKE47_00845 [Verrucomicrobiota bacterium]|nr:hypothetical protein [Verrucomicrobiota bacterium]